MTTLLIALALGIVMVLAGYAGWLHYRLWQQKKQQAAAKTTAELQPRQSDTQWVELKKSIYLLADAMLDDKMTHTEGCIRISTLAGYLETKDSFRQEYGVLFRVAEATAHIPILDSWKALSKEDKLRFDRERKSIEQKYKDAVIEAAGRIRARFSSETASDFDH